MRIFFLTVAITSVCLACPTQAQRVTFEKIYRTLPAQYTRAIGADNGQILAINTFSPRVAVGYDNSIILLSRSLDSVAATPVLNSYVGRGGLAKSASGSGYVCSGSVISGRPGDRSDDILQRFSPTLGPPLWSRTYNYGLEEASGGVLTANDGYLVMSYSSRSYRSQINVFRTDTAGVELWRKEYGWSLNDFATDWKYTRNGNIVLVGSTSPPPSYDFKLKMMLLNPLGDSLKSLAYAPTRGPSRTVLADISFNDRVIVLRDGGFLALAAVDSSNSLSNRPPLPLLVKVNAQLQPQWDYIQRPPRNGLDERLTFDGAVELQDSSLLVLASYGLPPVGQRGRYYLLRFSKSGQPLATTVLNCALCPQIQTNKLLADGDSALFVLGTCYGGPSGSRRAYGAHISLRGLPGVVAPLATGPPRQPAPTQVQLETLYPNPAADRVTLTYRCPTGLVGAGRLHLRDVLGRTLYETPVPARANGSLAFSVAGLAAGVYQCVLQWPGLPPSARKLLVRP